MRRAASLLLSLSAAACASEEKIDLELRVTSINLRHDVDWWEERFPLIADEITRLRPDLIGMQEVEIVVDQAYVLGDLIKDRGGKTYSLHQELKSGLAALGGEGIATFSGYPILTSSVADLGVGRVVTFDRLQISPTLQVDFYNTHLHNEGGDEVRKPQAEKLHAWVMKNDAGNPTFLTGDMNAREESETIRYFLQQGWIDSFKAVHGTNTATIGNTSPVKLAKMPVEQDHFQRIDYVFARPAPAGTTLVIMASEVTFKNARADGLYPSDHFGVSTTFHLLRE